MLKVKKITLPQGFFSGNSEEDLTQRLDIGICHFWYLYKDPSEHDYNVLREAVGTRNMLCSLVDWNDIPKDIKDPPYWVRTYYDIQRGEWRCFIKDFLVKYLDEIWIDDEQALGDYSALPIPPNKYQEFKESVDKQLVKTPHQIPK